MECTICGFSFDNGNLCPACGSEIKPHNPTEKNREGPENTISKEDVAMGPESEVQLVNHPVAKLRESISIPFGTEEAPPPVLYPSVPYGIGHAPIVDR